MKNISKVALVHDWLTGMRGGEKVLEIFCELFPAADIFTLIHLPGSVSSSIEKHRIFTSFLQKMPLIKKKYRYYLPFMPRAIESFNLSEYDLVISTSHCAAKGCKPRKDAIHICCCLTPMRYIWDQYQNYFEFNSALAVELAMKLIRPQLQRWDVKSSKRVTEFIAISQFVAERIKNYYRRESTVIHPPVDTDFFAPPTSDIGLRTSDYYLVVSALAPYKRIDIAIEAFNKNEKNLKIIGNGQSEKRLKVIAGPNIEFLGWLSDQGILNYYRNCAALIFPGTEDFGIVPLEAMSCGKPVIALRAGGVLETMVEGKTGVFFLEQNTGALMRAVEDFEKMSWEPEKIRQHALMFGKKVFAKNIADFFKERFPQIDLNTPIY